METALSIITRLTPALFILHRLPALHRSNEHFVEGDPDGTFQGLPRNFLPGIFTTRCIGLEFYPHPSHPYVSNSLKARWPSSFTLSVPLTSFPTRTSPFNIHGHGLRRLRRPTSLHLQAGLYFHFLPPRLLVLSLDRIDFQRCLVQAHGGEHSLWCLSSRRPRQIPRVPLREPVSRTVRACHQDPEPCRRRESS